MRFLLVRFTHGSGGKFLSSVLQTSSVVDHWCSTLQSHKNTTYWLQLLAQYTKRSFPRDDAAALHTEPHVPYCCDLYSASRERGQDVDLRQYLAHAHERNDYRLLACRDQQLICNLIFHRAQVPMFCFGMPAVTISVSTDREQKWLDKTQWKKHFIVTDTEIIHAPDDIDYCHITCMPDVIKYNNISRWSKDQEPMLKQKFLTKNTTRDWYFNIEKFYTWDNQHGIDNYFIPLASFFSREKFQDHVKFIFNKFDLGCPDLSAIDLVRQIWVDNQIEF